MTDSATCSPEKTAPEHRLVLAAGPTLKPLPTPGPGPPRARQAPSFAIDFSAPLAGIPRAEKIKQMAQKHPAYERSRYLQEVLVKMQHTLRRMTGVPGKEAGELVAQLQEVGQVVSQETGQLVDAMMKLTLDQQDSDRAVARLSIEANLAKARHDDQARAVVGLEQELARERERRQQAERRPALDAPPTTARARDLVTFADPSAASAKLQGLAEAMCRVSERVLRQASAEIRDESRSRTGASSRKPDPESTPADRSKPASLPMEPPRAPAAFGQDRRPSASWAPGSGPRAASGGGLVPTAATFTMPARPTLHHAARPPRASGPEAALWPPFGLGPSGFGPRREGIFPSTPVGVRPGSRFNEAAAPVPGGGPEPSARPASSPSSWALVSRPGMATAGPAQFPERTIAAWNEQIMDLYGAIRLFVERHAAAPDHGSVLKIGSAALWPVLLATYHPLSETEATSYLEFHLRNENSKACVVTRVIVDYIVNRVWWSGAWTGSDSKSTQDLLGLERELEAAQGQPSAARQPLLNKQAAIIGSILKNEQGTAWHRAKKDHISRILFSTVQPLLNRTVSRPEATHDLDQVADIAWALSSKILTSRLTFDFRFPEIGSRFSFQSMLPIWPHMDPMELQAKHWRVALVTTPVITCRNDSGGNISAHSVALADVFCMQ